MRRINPLEVVFDGTHAVFRFFESLRGWARDRSGLADVVLCRVAIKSHVLLDEEGRALDGDFVGGQLPTGNATPGGDFESWFTLVIEG